MPKPDHRLERIREKIDAIDAQFLELLAHRADLAKEVAAIKNTQKHPVFYRPEREAQVLRSIVKRNNSQLPDRAVERIFRDIMTACLALQQPLSIAYLGPECTFSEQAAIKHFGEGTVLSPCNTIQDIFRAVNDHKVNYGVVPIENSTEGMINLSLDQLISSQVHICGEVNLRIHQHFTTREDAQTIKTIYSHQQSLAQCRQWIATHYPKAKLIEVASNAVAAQRAAEDKNAAAICGELAAQHYKLLRRHSGIEDFPNNTTRFIIIGHQKPAPSGRDKTSLIISSPHTAGSLSKILSPFDKHALNMTLIESRPYRHRNWTYIFFIDFEGHQDDPTVKMALDELAQASVMLTLLGSYPQALD